MFHRHTALLFARRLRVIKLLVAHRLLFANALTGRRRLVLLARRRRHVQAVVVVINLRWCGTGLALALRFRVRVLRRRVLRRRVLRRPQRITTGEKNPSTTHTTRMSTTRITGMITTRITSMITTRITGITEVTITTRITSMITTHITGMDEDPETTNIISRGGEFMRTYMKTGVKLDTLLVLSLINGLYYCRITLRWVGGAAVFAADICRHNFHNNKRDIQTNCLLHFWF